MIEDICLNHNDPTVRNWFNFYGIEETYRQYALNNGLPVKPQYTFNDVKEYLNNYIPADQFKYENIRTILSRLPVGSQAAFWRDTFYFKDTVEKNEIDEELFHAVVSTILTKEQRDTLYSEGAKLINVEQRVKELSELHPQTYDLLSEQEKRERVVEEHLADLFVKSFKEVSLLDKFSNFIQELFNTIKDFFGFATNRDYIETVFDNIKSGKYKNSNIVYSENTTPSTYILKGRATSGVQQDLSESESDQVIRNLRAIYFDQKYKTDLDHSALINRTIEIAKSYYEVKNPVVNGAFEAKLQEFNFETGLLDSVDNPDYIDLIDVLNTRINEVSPFMFDLIEEDQGDNITDENADSEYANISDFNSANEAGFDNISGWLKMYISTVGNIVPVEINGETIEFIEAVDENKIYYGVARALNNSRNDFERFIKLIELGTIEGNTTANAFLNKLIRDITGSKDLDVIQNIQNDYLNTYLQTKDASVINNYINPSRAYILQNVLKGFDLWSRTDLFQTISPETGNTITFDANVNNSVNNQLSNWQQNIIDNQSNSEILNGLVAQLAITGNFNTKLNNAITNNLNVLDEFGININPETIKWLLINNAINTYGVDKLNLSAKDLVRQNAFNNEINNYGDKTVISSLLDTIRKYSDKAEDLFDADGIRGKLEILAKINGVFDENVYESSRKNAEGKTIYSFQWKTFDLEFINNLQDQSFVNDLMNKGAVNYRTDAQGNEIYLTESQDFFKNNYFLKQFDKFKNIVPYIKLASVDGLRQTSEENEGREGDGVTFSNILTKDFDLWRLNAAVNRTIEVEGEKLYWHYLGNLEAKRTADGVYLPEIKGLVNNGLTQKASSLLKEEVRKEYDRIKRVHLELKEVIENNNLSFNDEGVINLSSTTLRQYLNKDVYEKYHTGKLRRELVGDSYIYHSQGVRALEFTDSVNGILPKDFMKNELTNAALQNKSLEEVWNDEMLKNHWNNIFNTHKQKLINEGIIPNLDKRWKIGEQLDNQKFENYIVSSYINVLSFNQIMHGDPALIYKNDGSGTDMYKRFAGRNAAVSSMESYLINPDFGITEVKNKVKYVVGDEFKSKVAFAPENSIDQADAQNYATTEYKRYLLWSKGRLTKFLAQALDDIELGYELTPQQNRVMLDNKEYFNVDKTVGFNGYQYLKKGDWMLTKELTSILSYEAEKQLETLDKYSEEAKKIRQDENNWIPRKDYKFHHDLRQNMEGWRRSSDGTLVKDNKKKYDLYMPISASKMLNVNVFNPSTGWNNTDSSIVHIAAKNYGLQLENPAGKKRIIDPSQMLEIIFNEQDDTVTVKYKGENRKITDLESLYQQYLTDRDEVMSDLVYNQLFDGEEFDAENFFPKAVKSLINSGADPQTIKIFQVENGKPLYNPNIGITKDKFTNLLFAEISKGLKHKVSGDALAHVSSYGIRPIKQIRKVEIGRGSGVFDYTWSVLDRNDPTYKKINYDVIPLVELNLEDTIEDQIIYDPTLPTDALRTKLKELYESGQYYFSDELRHLKPRYNYIDYGTEYDIVDEKVISYHSESVMPPSRLDDQFINSNNKYNFGVRIPSQDKHSAVNVEWTNTLPIYYGNTIAVAKEVMFLSGHDHDIDKLFLQKPELYKYNNSWIKYGDGDKWVEYIEFLKDSDSNFKKQYQLLGIEKLGTVEFDIQVKDLLNKLRIPNYQDKNPYTINNQLLELKQLALTNNGTLNSKVVNEKIIEGSYKTPASMTALQDLDKGELFVKNNKSLFATTNELPAHIFNTHSNVHTKNTVGKVNINPYVNGNLGLIQAIRAGYKINPDFQITINDHQIKSFGYLSAGNQRIFDTLSTLISAATDEAKEQLNAKYKLNLDGAVIAKTMVSLGFDLDTSILFVNQPIIQQYFKQKENRFQTVYLESEYKSDEEIIASLGGIENGYLGEYGNNELSNNLKGEFSIEPNILNKRILNDLLVFEKVNKQTSLLTRFLKVKKGFVDGLDQLDQLNEAVDALGFNIKPKAYKKFMENNPLNTHLTLKDENIYSKIPQVYNVIKNVLPTVNKITSKLLLSRSIPVQSVKQRVFEQLKNLSNDNKTKIEREIDSYIFMRSYLNENVDRSILTNNLFKRGDHATVGATFDKLKQKVTSLAKKEATTADEKLLKDLYGTSILKRLIVKTNKKTNIDELKLDTFAKLSPEQQDNLIESYGLLIKNLSYLSDDYIEFKNLPQQMFAYWVMKDGFQNKFGSVAKLFPVYMFKVHSSTIDKILNNSDEEQLEKLMSDSSINDVVKRIAQNNITSKNLKTFYKPNNLTSQPIHNNYIVDFSKLRNNESAIVNYPFEFNDNKLIFVPFYTRMSGASLELSRVLLKDKTVLTNTQGDFYELVRNSKILKDVIKVEYKPIAKNDIQYQSIMTQDLNYSNIDGVSDVENDGVSEDYEGEIIIKKGCDSSLD